MVSFLNSLLTIVMPSFSLLRPISSPPEIFPMPTMKPLLVIRDPPGGLSSVTYTNVETTIKVTVDEYEKYEGVDGGFFAHLMGKIGAGGCAGPVVTVACFDVAKVQLEAG